MFRRSNLEQVPGKDKKKKGSSMDDAVTGTENIRNWDEHLIGVQELCTRLNTNKD